MKRRTRVNLTETRSGLRVLRGLTRTAAAVGLGAPLLAFGGGCTSGCRPLDLETATVTGGSGPVRLRARALDEGKPVGGLRLRFYLRGADGVGREVGSGRTGPDGVARALIARSVGELESTGEPLPTAYSVKGDALSNGEFCEGEANGRLELGR